MVTYISLILTMWLILSERLVSFARLEDDGEIEVQEPLQPF